MNDKTMKNDERLTHLTLNEKAALGAFITNLTRQYSDQLVRIILFGSKARGDCERESDLDVLIVLHSGDWRFRDAVALVAFEPMVEHGVVLSPLVVDVEDYSWWQEHRAPIYRAISAEGIELWTRDLSQSSASG